MNNAEKMSEKLNGLLAKNYDAEKGYKKAAEIVDNPKLKRFFENQAQNRYDFGHELKTEIKNIGENPEKGTSFKGDMHRAWMDIRSTFTSNDEEKIVAEVEKGESAALKEYSEVLTETNLAPSTRSIIVNQVSSIEDAARTVKNLKQVFA